LSYFFVIQKDR